MEQVIDESSECDEWRSNWWFICHRVCERIFFQLCEMFLICISPVRLLKEMFFSRSSYVLSDGKSPDQEPYIALLCLLLHHMQETQGLDLFIRGRGLILISALNVLYNTQRFTTVLGHRLDHPSKFDRFSINDCAIFTVINMKSNGSV